MHVLRVAKRACKGNMNGRSTAMQNSMSHAQLDTLLKKQKGTAVNSVALNRSSSVSVGIKPSNLNRIEQSRRALYEAMPFTTVHGLQFKEHTLHKVLSHKSLLQAASGAAESEVRQSLLNSPSRFIFYL